MIEFKDQDLILRLRSTEDNFTERKTSGDSKDWLKTVVAFANSTPVGYPAVLYIGVKNDGTLEDKPVNLESIQKTFDKEVGKAYPPIYLLKRILVVGGKECLAVIVPGSEDRPHFAGPSYVRSGSQSVKASEKQFGELIASRNSKVREILKWKGKTVTIGQIRTGQSRPYSFGDGVVEDCNQFFLTVKSGESLLCVPLQRIEVSFDTQQQRLQLEEHPA